MHRLPPNSTEPEPKLRWYQYSLRSILIVAIMFCLLFAWIGVKIRQGQKQKEIVEWVEKNGGRVHYDIPFNPEANNSASNNLPSRGFLAVWIGVDYFYNVEAVYFPVTEEYMKAGIWTDELALKPLYGLPHLTTASFGQPPPSVQNLQAELPNCKIFWKYEFWEESFESPTYWCKECNDWNDSSEGSAPHTTPNWLHQPIP